MKDFRNAIAHNKVVFDGRYMEFLKRDSVCKLLEHSTGIKGIQFSSVYDDIILVIFLMKNLGFSKVQLHKIVSQLSSEITKLFKKMDYSLYKEIVPADTKAKLQKLERYITKKK